MKKIIVILPLLFLLIGCRSDEESNSTTTRSTRTSEVRNTQGDGNVLVAYFSMPLGNNQDVTTGASVLEMDGEYVGLTEQTAKWISEELKADTFQIQVENDYPTNIRELIELTIEEKDNAERPSLASKITNIESYDTIYLGYPIWNGDFPMAVYTFLESYDFSDKKIIPFSTHGGSGLAGTIRVLEEKLPTATVETDTISISRGDVAESQNEILTWLEEMKE